MMFRIEGPVNDAAEREMAEIISAMGMYSQQFAIVELVVTGWILRVEADPILFLTKTRQFASRIQRLRAMLKREGLPESNVVTDALDKLEALLEMRNDITHGVVGASGTFVSLVTWKATIPISVLLVQAEISALTSILRTLGASYGERFKSDITLQVMKGAPPATE